MAFAKFALRTLCSSNRQFQDAEHSLDVSYHSFSTGLLPALGARSNSHLRLRKHTISPYDPRYRWWQNFMVILVIYSAWVSPFELAFMSDLPKHFVRVDYAVDTFFAIDIVMTFFVAYLDTTTYLLVDRKSRIALRNISIFYDKCQEERMENAELKHDGGTWLSIHAMQLELKHDGACLLIHAKMFLWI